MKRVKSSLQILAIAVMLALPMGVRAQDEATEAVEVTEVAPTETVEIVPTAEPTPPPSVWRQLIDDAVARAKGIAPEVVALIIGVFAVAMLILAIPALILIYRSAPPWVVQGLAPGINQGLLGAGGSIQQRKQQILGNTNPDDDWIAGLLDSLANTTDEQRKKLADEAAARGIVILVDPQSRG